MRETNVSEPLMTHRNGFDDAKTGSVQGFRDEHGLKPTYRPCGVRCTGGVTLTQAFVRNLGTYTAMQREKAQGQQSEAESTNALVRGGLLRSSDEVG